LLEIIVNKIGVFHIKSQKDALTYLRNLTNYCHLLSLHDKSAKIRRFII
jgi:hypothetical protein